jgi:hypothetical protein
VFNEYPEHDFIDNAYDIVLEQIQSVAKYAENDDIILTLKLAIRKKQIRIIDFLLELGFHGPHDSTLILHAVNLGHTALVKRLFENDPDRCRTLSNRIFTAAIQNGYIDIAQYYLLELPYTMSVRCEGYSVLMDVLQYRAVQLIEPIIKQFDAKRLRKLDTYLPKIRGDTILCRELLRFMPYAIENKYHEFPDIYSMIQQHNEQYAIQSL